MPSPFLSSEEYDERAHKLYNEGDYDQALNILKEGLSIYPNAVELHIGVGYAYHAREDYAWARRAFEEALVLDPEHEDAMAGLGETLLKFGQRDAAIRSFHRTVELGYSDDIDLMLQIGRALFREGIIDEARGFFQIAVQQAPESAEAHACVGYAEHRLGNDEAAASMLRKALRLDASYVEARIYLANLLYDRGEYEPALHHLEKSQPDDHWDELGIWRLIELKKSIYKLQDGDPERVEHLHDAADHELEQHQDLGVTIARRPGLRPVAARGHIGHRPGAAGDPANRQSQQAWSAAQAVVTPADNQDTTVKQESRPPCSHQPPIPPPPAIRSAPT